MNQESLPPCCESKGQWTWHLLRPESMGGCSAPLPLDWGWWAQAHVEFSCTQPKLSKHKDEALCHSTAEIPRHCLSEVWRQQGCPFPHILQLPYYSQWVCAIHRGNITWLPGPGGQESWHSEQHGTVTIRKTVLGMPPSIGYCTDSKLRHKRSSCKKALFT